MVRGGRPAVAEFAGTLTDTLTRLGAEVVAPGDEATPDMILGVGGDGTMLAAARIALDDDIPVLGFNLGTLGFLTEAEPSDLEAVLPRLLAADYQVEERMTVAARAGEREEVGLNDVVIEKIDTTRLVSLEVVIDGSPLTTQRADGLIVATPTGSTAYSFSAGGPLLDPALEALVVTPVAAHSLFDRSIVVPASSVIEVTVTQDRSVRVNVDKGGLGTLGEGDEVEVRTGERPSRFVTLGDRSFASLI
ncbi:MAG: NAD(+)/NADH kinase, partial [Actinobacteria bacterium]|nr:NAD(+)/NADH kinase [Actinomycetota bacterium]